MSKIGLAESKTIHELPMKGERPWSGDPNAVVLYDSEAMIIHNQVHTLLRYAPRIECPYLEELTRAECN